MSGDMMAVALKGSNLLQAVPMILNQAETKGGPHRDNLSVVAVRWEDAYVEEASSAISTQTMSQDEVTTRLEEFGRNPAYKSELSDERSKRRSTKSATPSTNTTRRNKETHAPQPTPAGPAPHRQDHPQFHPPRRRLGADRNGRHPRAMHRLGRRKPAALPARQGPGLGDRRIRHAAALDAHRSAREAAKGKTDRPHPGNPAPDRPQPAPPSPTSRPRRTPDHPRLRRAAGRRRHPLRLDHRRLDRPHEACDKPGRRPASCRPTRSRTMSRRFVGIFEAARCSTSTTRKTPTATPT